MRPTRAGILLLGVICLLAAGNAGAGTVPADARGALPSLAPVLAKVLPGVVSIAVQGRAPVAAEQNPLQSDPFFRRFFGLPEQPDVPKEQEFQAAGSGVVVDAARGYVLTNNHVIEHADRITVTLSDGRHLDAKKIGTDPATDVAVVQVAAGGLTALPFGNSDALKVGDYVIAVGNPFGLRQTATSGIVSALGRSGLGIEGYESFIQTDASINPGNSGGALVDLHGNLVGINTAIVGPAGGNVGIGFAIPINMAKRVMDQLIAHGKVSRGQLGVTIQDLTPDLAKGLNIDAREGALIAAVTPKSPAAKAGLVPGDVVTAVNGAKVLDSSDLRNKVGLMPIGSKITLDIIHRGRPKKVVAVLAEIRSEKVKVPATLGRLSGVVLGPIEPGSPYYGKVQGAVVTEVKKGSRADRAGLVPGDIIVGVDQQPVSGPADVVALASRAGKRNGLLLQIVRDGGGLFIVVG